MLDEQNPKNLSMEQNLERMLKAQPTLDPVLFDVNTNLLKPEVRTKLLLVSEQIIDKCIKPFPFFGVRDVVICGSADSYYYHKYSDIDLKILIRQQAGEYNFAYELQAKNLANQYIRAFLQKGYKIQIEGKNIEFGVEFYYKDQQSYSLFGNDWIKEPRNDWHVGLDKEKILQQAKDLQKQMEDYYSLKYERPYGKYDIEDVMQMKILYNKIVKMKFENLEGMMINKLLVYGGQMKDFHDFYIREASNIFAL